MITSIKACKDMGSGGTGWHKYFLENKSYRSGIIVIQLSANFTIRAPLILFSQPRPNPKLQLFGKKKRQSGKIQQSPNSYLTCMYEIK